MSKSKKKERAYVKAYNAGFLAGVRHMEERTPRRRSKLNRMDDEIEGCGVVRKVF